MRLFKDNLPHHVECEFLFNVDVAIKENVKILTFRQRDHVKPVFNAISTDWQAIFRAA